jgi:hypothetical protein
MVSEKALYWISAGLIACAALNHAVVRRDFASPINGAASQLVQRFFDRGERYASITQVALSSKEQCRRNRVVGAQVQGRVADLQTILAREQYGMARLESQKAQLVALKQLKCATVSLSTGSFKVEAADPDVAIDASF